MLAVQVFFTACKSTIGSLVHFGFFWLVAAPVNATHSLSLLEPHPHATACNARKQSSREASLSANHTSYNHFLVGRRCHPGFGALSIPVVWFSASLAVMAKLVPTLNR
ncbi:MAG: hypothetical protein V7K47_16155 [Nostoc sp.]